METSADVSKVCSTKIRNTYSQVKLTTLIPPTYVLISELRIGIPHS